MSQFVIAELKDDQLGEIAGKQSIKPFAPRGAVKQLWKTRDFETIVAGPAETGKTWGCLHYVDALLWKYPGANGVMVRKTYADLVASALQSYLRIIGPESPIKAYGGARPQWFDYPNGSRLWTVGLDNAGKVLSTERDFFYVNQTEELMLEDWETMTTRCTGRGATMPYTRIFGDCNPGPPQHWIIQRRDAAKTKLLESRHEDNPTLYSDTGELTEQGKRTMAILDALSGVRKLRLRKGFWAAAEGVVYEDFDAAENLEENSFAIRSHWRRIRVIDFGYTNPFVCQWWAIDEDGRMYLYREIYRTRRLVEDHAKDIIRLSEGETIEATISDHDAEDRATLHRHGVLTVPAYKSVSRGIENVNSRLRKSGDGKPRMFILKNVLVKRDERLVESRLPISTEQEIPEYSYPKGADGKPIKEDPVKLNDHGCDAMRYAAAYVDRLAFGEVKVVGGRSFAAPPRK